jgi:hypothetical protein
MDDAAQLATGVAAAVTAASAWYLFGGAAEPKKGKKKKKKKVRRICSWRAEASADSYVTCSVSLWRRVRGTRSTTTGRHLGPRRARARSSGAARPPCA